MVLLGGGGAGPLTRVAFFVLPTLAAALLLVQTSFVMLYPNRNDQAQNTVSGLLSLLACVVALLRASGSASPCTSPTSRRSCRSWASR
jgi:hypothetical protein